MSSNRTETPTTVVVPSTPLNIPGFKLATSRPDPSIHSPLTCELYDIAARLQRIQSAMKRHEPLQTWAGGSQLDDSVGTIREAILGIAGTGDVLAMIEVEVKIETGGMMAVLS